MDLLNDEKINKDIHITHYKELLWKKKQRWIKVDQVVEEDQQFGQCPGGGGLSLITGRCHDK